MPRSESIGARALEFSRPEAMRVRFSNGERDPTGVAFTPSTLDGSLGAVCSSYATTTDEAPAKATVPMIGPRPIIRERRELDGSCLGQCSIAPYLRFARDRAQAESSRVTEIQVQSGA